MWSKKIIFWIFSETEPTHNLSRNSIPSQILVLSVCQIFYKCLAVNDFVESSNVQYYVLNVRNFMSVSIYEKYNVV